MAYTPYFKDRLVEHPGRIKLTNVVDGTEATYDVTRAEGTVTVAGTLLNASNMDYGTTLGYIQLNTAAASTTLDGKLTAAISALGWTSDVIE